MVTMKHVMTTMVANIPNDLIGIILLEVHDKNATAEVSDVTIIYFEACAYVYEILKIGCFLIASIVKEFCQLSWKTKISSAPIPTMMIMTERWRLEK